MKKITVHSMYSVSEYILNLNNTITEKGICLLIKKGCTFIKKTMLVTTPLFVCLSQKKNI